METTAQKTNLEIQHDFTKIMFDFINSIYNMELLSPKMELFNDTEFHYIGQIPQYIIYGVHPVLFKIIMEPNLQPTLYVENTYFHITDNSQLEFIFGRILQDYGI